MAFISAVIPVYRSEKTLPELYLRLRAALGKVSPDYEILFVDDHGGDGSWNVISDLVHRDKRVAGSSSARISASTRPPSAASSGPRANGSSPWTTTWSTSPNSSPSFTKRPWRVSTWFTASIPSVPTVGGATSRPG